MDFMTILIAILSIVGAFIAKLAASELRDWIPWIASRMINHAVASLPEAHKERYREEWHSHLDDCPGAIGKLIHACGCVIGQRAIAAELSKTASKTALEESAKTLTKKYLKRDFKFHCASCGAVTRYRKVRTITISPIGDTTSDNLKMVCSMCNAETFLL